MVILRAKNSIFISTLRPMRLIFQTTYAGVFVFISGIDTWKYLGDLARFQHPRGKQTHCNFPKAFIYQGIISSGEEGGWD